jgi:hypothetical protein
VSARYERNELLNVTLRGVRVVNQVADSVRVVGGEWPSSMFTIDLPVGHVDVTVRRAVPADGVPQAGDIWVDQFGGKYFVRAGVQDNVLLVPAAVSSSSQVHWETLHAGPEGPIKLLWREGWSPQPAAPAVEVPGDDPVDKQPSFAASLRILADWLDAHPDFPLPTWTAGISAALGSVDRVREAASMLGAPVQDYVAESGKRHVVVEHEFGRISLRLSRVEDPVVDGSPSDLDGPPEADEPAEFGGVHERAGGRAGGPGDCAVWCACGVTYDGFDTIAEAGALLDEHIATANAGPGPSDADGGVQS